jgi:hypothetical protein
MKYTVGDYLLDQWYTVCYCWPASFAAVPVIKAAATLANAARRLRCKRLARRLAWYAYDVADHTRTGREFDFLPAMMPWAFGAGDWDFRP